MWFILSMIAILFWSGSDLFSKMGSKSEDKYSHWKMIMSVGFIMGIHAVITLAMGAEFTPGDIITYLPASFCYILSMILGYVGLRYIVLSVSTPICNSSGAVACLLCFLFLDASMNGMQFIAVALICIGVLLLSIIEKKQEDRERALRNETADKKYTKSLIAIAFPLLYCLIDGLGTFADAWLLESEIISEEAGNIAYELTFLMMAVFALIYVVVIKKQKIRLTDEKPKLVAGVCETAGQLAYVYAIGANAIIAAPMISSYCIFSLLWARIILKEKLTAKQYMVIAIAAIGIVILGVYDA